MNSITHRPGLLCIGDSAHAMSPVGGVGINLAIQDAVATANLLGDRLREGRVDSADLAAVRARRERATKLTQRLQVFVHTHVLARVFQASSLLSPPWPLRLINAFPILRRIPARIIGIGFRPEHVKNRVLEMEPPTPLGSGVPSEGKGSPLSRAHK